MPTPSTVTFPNGATVPALGQGTWMMGQGRHTEAEEIEALRLGIIGHPELAAIARRHAATEGQIALAWCLAQPGVIAIPKSGNPTHVRENAAAAAIDLSAEDLALLDKAFPPPKKRQRLEML